MSPEHKKHLTSGKRLEQALITAVGNLVRGRLNPDQPIVMSKGQKPQPNTLLPHELLQASKHTDSTKGTDVFILNVPVDITELPIEKKKNTEEQFSTMSFMDPEDRIVVDFGVRYGNNSTGKFTKFDKPVLVISSKDADEAASSLNDNYSRTDRSREDIAKAFTRHFDDIMFTGMLKYHEAIGTAKPLIVFVTDSEKGAFPLASGKKLVKERASNLTGYSSEDIHIMWGVNPHVGIVASIAQDYDILSFGFYELPTDKTRGTSATLKPIDTRLAIDQAIKQGRGHELTMWDLTIENS